jgi:hypothetical protein
MEHSALQSLPLPDLPLRDIQMLRSEALSAGALDPMNLRFRVLEYDKASGELLGVPIQNIGFLEAVETTARLIRSRSDSHFCLHPVGFIQ